MNNGAPPRAMLLAMLFLAAPAVADTPFGEPVKITEITMACKDQATIAHLVSLFQSGQKEAAVQGLQLAQANNVCIFLRPGQSVLIDSRSGAYALVHKVGLQDQYWAARGSIEPDAEPGK